MRKEQGKSTVKNSGQLQQGGSVIVGGIKIQPQL